MPSSHVVLDQVDSTFDDQRSVALAGLLLPATLAERLGIEQATDQLLDLGGRPGAAHPGRKLLTLVYALAAGGDRIDDVELLRCGSMDPDSTICEVHGYHKQGACCRYTHRLGCHPLLATHTGSGEVLHARLRKGSANTARGILWFADELVARCRRAGAIGDALVGPVDEGDVERHGPAPLLCGRNSPRSVSCLHLPGMTRQGNVCRPRPSRVEGAALHKLGN
jgi:hypothetical protein